MNRIELVRFFLEGTDQGQPVITLRLSALDPALESN